MSLKIPTLIDRTTQIWRFQTANGEVVVRCGDFSSLKKDILELRQAAYVNMDGRLSDCDDMQDTFDVYNDFSHFCVAFVNGQAAGCLKVIASNPHGLPCGEYTSLGGYDLKRACEFGHLMVRPELRAHGMGMALMKVSLDYCIRSLKAQFIFGDFFVDKNDGNRLHDFYRKIGFIEMSPPYMDHRFVGAPLSMVGLLDVEVGLRNYENREGPFAPTLEFFFEDYIHEH